MNEQPDALKHAPDGSRENVSEHSPARPESRSAKPPGAGDYGEQDQNGVDLSLLRSMLRLSPLERLRVMEQHARDTQLLYEYGRRHREAKAAGDR